MATRIAINGLGRIGRAVFKIALDTPELQVVAVNDIVPADNLAYLLKYDTVYGRYEKHVEAKNALIVVGERYPVFGEKDPANLPWRDLKVDIAIESTGVFTREEQLRKHIEAGAKHVILSAPVRGSDGEAEILTVVHGVNSPDAAPQIISCAVAPPTASRRWSRSSGGVSASRKPS